MGFVLHEDKVKREGSFELEFFCPSSGFCFPQRLSEERRRIRGEKKREKEFLSPQKRKRKKKKKKKERKFTVFVNFFK